MNDRSTAEGILFTDQYQLTMAQLYFRLGMHERQAQFDHFFRNYPDYGEHRAGFCVNAGLEWLLDWMEEARFRKQEISLLRGMTSRTGRPLFAEDFLSWLAQHGDFGGISILPHEDAALGFDQCDLGAEAGERLGQFDTDRAGADDRQPPGEFRQ